MATISDADDLLPGRWYGYDAADAVAIDTNDKAILAALSAGRGEALRRWVERGGHLVVAVSSNWQAVAESILGPMLPLRLNGQVQVEPYEALEAFAGGTKPIESEANQGRVAKFEEIEARGGQVIASTLSTPLIVRGALWVRPGHGGRHRRRRSAILRLGRPPLVLGQGARPQAAVGRRQRDGQPAGPVHPDWRIRPVEPPGHGTRAVSRE